MILPRTPRALASRNHGFGALEMEWWLFKDKKDSVKATKAHFGACSALFNLEFDASEPATAISSNDILSDCGSHSRFDFTDNDPVATKAIVRQDLAGKQRKSLNTIAEAVSEDKREIEESISKWQLVCGPDGPSFFESLLNRPETSYQHVCPIDSNYVSVHALRFQQTALHDFNAAKAEFIDNLDAHIGRVTAKWKEQGVYTAVTNISALFEYGRDDHVLRQVFLTQLHENIRPSLSDSVEASPHPTWLSKDQRSTSALEDAVNIYEIPGFIGSMHKVNALGDFCAKVNFMRIELAQRLGLPINRESATSVTIGSGRKVTTQGTVATHFDFANEPGSYPIVFHLLPNCIHDVILGKGFLKATKTFSSFMNQKRRVVKRVISGITQAHFLYLGDNGPKFTGLLNGRKQDALADSGSKVLIMDEDYARSMGIPIQSDRRYHTKLRFADNSTAITSGMTYGVQWEFGHEGNNVQHMLDFHILRNAPAAVILSDDFLFATNAYSEFDCYLIDEDDEDEDAYFFAIDYDPKYQYQQNTANFPLDDMPHTELIRRGEEDDRIADLPIAEQAEARNAETQRRTAWDDRRAQLTQQASSTTTSQQSSTDAVSPPPEKKSRWRFKLKRRKP
ncbi:hypothetical protein BKA63DRAFT_562913 [Paraphoma chrysanthemicola]|nr:hypothetical protein BKA63DRAFT_562913 [Paraphoma chrysanthemicola]